MIQRTDPPGNGQRVAATVCGHQSQTKLRENRKQFVGKIVGDAIWVIAPIRARCQAGPVATVRGGDRQSLGRREHVDVFGDRRMIRPPPREKRGRIMPLWFGHPCRKQLTGPPRPKLVIINVVSLQQQWPQPRTTVLGAQSGPQSRLGRSRTEPEHRSVTVALVRDDGLARRQGHRQRPPNRIPIYEQNLNLGWQWRMCDHLERLAPPLRWPRATGVPPRTPQRGRCRTADLRLSR